MDKELLLQDLYSRVPYKVIVHVESHDSGVSHSFDNTLIGIQKDCAIVMRKNGIITNFPIALGGCSVKPYLRKISSMSAGEMRSLEDEIRIRCAEKYCEGKEHFYIGTLNLREINNIYRWLNSHHFDYNGLIENGLAIEVTIDNDPYRPHTISELKDWKQ